MSEQYPGGFISKTEPTVNGSVARGMWTLSQAAGYAKQGLWPTVPAAPTIGTATAGANSASVAFTAPSNIGSSAITSYTATSSPGGFTGTGASSPITVSGLTNGTAYTFTVTATNGAGTGPASSASNSVTPAQINYIEDVYSTYLYTGTGAEQTIVNGIDLASKGGLVWAKARNSTTYNNHILSDTARGPDVYLSSNSNAAQAGVGSSAWIHAFNSNGFTAGDNIGTSTIPYTSWTFRKQPKFFDVVTWTGNDSTRQISHSLGSAPGCIIVKCTSEITNWPVYHRSLGASADMRLNTTAAQDANSMWANTSPTSTVFTVSGNAEVNGSGRTYVAYLFAHDAGGFGLTGTDNVISCGSYAGSSNTPQQITLGYEPQWVLLKKSSTTDSWRVFDNMRGMALSTGGNAILEPNTSSAESASSNWILPNATGFVAGSSATDSATYIYIAIRRGPMKVPTSGTSVFKPLYEAGTGSARTVNAGFPTDLFFIKDSTGLTGPTAGGNVFYDRLRGNSNVLQTQSTAAEAVSGTYTALFNSVQNGVVVSDYWSSYAYREYCFQRAPSFFDEVCYTGTGATNNVAHNLTVKPEFIVGKRRNSTGNWEVYAEPVGATSYFRLNNNMAPALNSSIWNDTEPTSSVFTVGATSTINLLGSTYVAYLFATCAGVSKVGSYTGTGALLTVDCGFTSGARFVLIKRTDSTGDWYTYDSARGITSGNDPYLLLNSTAAEVTGTNYVDTDTTGFKVTAAAPAGLNASGGTYIFLAIA